MKGWERGAVIGGLGLAATVCGAMSGLGAALGFTDGARFYAGLAVVACVVAGTVAAKS